MRLALDLLHPCSADGNGPMSNSANRSFERITRTDLRRLSTKAVADLENFFHRYERWRPYQSRLMLICLCQGAALHYVAPHGGVATDRHGGVNDFDVWGFFQDRPNHRPFPPRRHGFQDFGLSKFGRNPHCFLANTFNRWTSCSDHGRVILAYEGLVMPHS